MKILKLPFEFPTKGQLWLSVIILVLVIFYLAKCHKTPTQPIPKSKEIHDTITVVKYDNRRLTDSFETVLRKHYKQDYQDSNYLIELLNQNSELSAINTNLQNQTYPDTCEKIVGLWKNQYNTYVTQTDKTLNQAKRSLVNLSSTIQTQKSYLSAKDSIIKRALSAADSCDTYLKRAEKYAKQVKPKHSINLNVQAISPFIGQIKPTFGAGIGYENRKGLEISLTYYTNQQISIGIRKPIFRF